MYTAEIKQEFKAYKVFIYHCFEFTKLIFSKIGISGWKLLILINLLEICITTVMKELPSTLI